MKITVPTSTFRLGIARAADAVNPASTLPAITNLLLEASGSVLTVTGTNLDQQARVEVACEVHEEGLTTLPAKKLADIIGAVKSDNVVLEMEDNRGTITAGKSVFKLSGLDATDFPRELFPPTDKVAEWTFKADELRQIFVQLTPVQSTEESRYVLMGIYLKSEGTELDWIAANGRALTIITTPHDGQEVAAIIPSGFVRQAIRAMEAEESVSLSLTGNSVKLVGKSIALTSKLVEGAYPSVKAAIPNDLSHFVDLPREEFLEVITRLTKIGPDFNKDYTVTLIGTKNNLEIVANHGEADSSSEDMPLKISEAFRYKANKAFLDAVLRNLSQDTVRMEYGTRSQPLAFKAGNTLSVVNIMRVKEDA